MYNRGSPPSDPRPSASHTVQHVSQQAPPHRSYVRQRQHSEPFIPEVHPPPPPPRRESGSDNARGSSSAGHSPQQLARTSPTTLLRGTVPLSRRNRTRSRSFHCAVPRAYDNDGEGQQRGPAFEYSDCFQSRRAQEILCDMWERQELCDVVLVTEEREFRAHRVVLASGSPYFRAMFLAGLSESKQSRVELKTIPAVLLEQILLYLYHSHFEVPVDLVQDAIPAADMLCIASLKEACAAYLQRQLSVTNCLGLYVFADTHSCTMLLEEALKIIQKHFSEVIYCDEFKQLSFEHLLSLVSMDCLTVSGEERVFEAIAAWVGHDMERRKQHFKELLKQVRLPLMSNEFLFDHVYKNNLIATDKECCDIFVNSLQFKYLPDRASGSHLLPQITPRRPPTHSLPTVAVFGGMGRSELCSSAEILVPPTSQWQSLPPMRLPRWGSGAACLDSEVYVAGGSDNSSRLCSVERFDVRTMKWSAAPHLNTPRNGVGLAVHNGCLYAIGGFNGQTPLKTVEMYSPATGQWSQVANMKEQRYGVGVGVMDDMIYVIGGTDSVDLNSAECFDTQLCTWTAITPMKKRRKYSGVAVVGGHVYVFGGCDGNTTHTSVEVYDPSVDQWTFAAPLFCPRSGMGVAVMHGFIYVIGGSNNGTPLSSVERYDPLSNRWVVDPSMATARDRLSACVVELTNMDVLSQQQTTSITSSLRSIHIRQYSS